MDDELAHQVGRAEANTLTPNDRLAREVARAFDQHRAADAVGWLPASVSSWNGYVADRYTRLRHSDPTQPRIASELELALTLQAVAPPGMRQLTAAAVEAWQLAHAYDLDDNNLLDRTDQWRRICGVGRTGKGCACRAAVDLTPGAASARWCARNGRRRDVARVRPRAPRSASVAGICATPRPVTQGAVSTGAPHCLRRRDGRAQPREPVGTIGAAVGPKRNRGWHRRLELDPPTRRIVERQVGANLDPELGAASGLFNVSGGTPLIAPSVAHG